MLGSFFSFSFRSPLLIIAHLIQYLNSQATIMEIGFSVLCVYSQNTIIPENDNSSPSVRKDNQCQVCSGSACVISQESLQKYYGGMVFTISTFALLQSVSNTAAQCIKYKSDHITLLLRTFQQLPVSLSQRPCYNLPVLWFDASPLPLWLHSPAPPTPPNSCCSINYLEPCAIFSKLLS